MLNINTLSVSYGRRPVLKDISLQVNCGEIFCLIGPNGAGKSTLIRAVSGALPAYSGKVSVANRDLTALNQRQRARAIAVVPQGAHFPPDFTVSETVLMGRTAHMNWLGQPTRLDHEQTHLAMEQAEVVELADRRIGELSGGEHQRVALARALAQDASLMLLDEPTAHLDLRYQSDLLKLVRGLTRQRNLAVLMVLHDLNLSSLYADRLALLVDGQIRKQGSPTEVLTVASLSQAYGIPVNVMKHPYYGKPLVLPDSQPLGAF